MYPYNLERVQALNSEDYLRTYIGWVFANGFWVTRLLLLSDEHVSDNENLDAVVVR